MTHIKGKKFIVTGGAGFIGSHLVDNLFAFGAEKVVVVDNFFLGNEANLINSFNKYGSTLKIYREDAGDINAMRSILFKEQPNVILNLASKALLYSFFNPAGACKVNFDIALVLGELLRESTYEKLIHLSSSEVYGTAQYTPMDEYHPLLAETSYAAGKASADLLLSSYYRMFDLDIVIIRPFNNYGPRQNNGEHAAIIPATLKRIQNGLEPLIQGNGLQTRDIIYVEDTVLSIIKLAGLNIKGMVLNLGSGRETTVLEIINQLCTLKNYKGGIKFLPQRTADVNRHLADIKKIKELIGEPSITTLEDGIKATVAWYDKQLP